MHYGTRISINDRKQIFLSSKATRKKKRTDKLQQTKPNRASFRGRRGGGGGGASPSTEIPPNAWPTIRNAYNGSIKKKKKKRKKNATQPPSRWYFDDKISRRPTFDSDYYFYYNAATRKAWKVAARSNDQGMRRRRRRRHGGRESIVLDAQTMLRQTPLYPPLLPVVLLSLLFASPFFSFYS